MDFNGAAKIRVGQWIQHIEMHKEEYEEFAQRSARYGSPGFAESIREMVNLTDATTECLRRAIDELEQ